MDDKGIIVYGYAEDGLRNVTDDIRNAVDADIIVLDATGHENTAISEIIDGAVPGTGRPLGTKLVMFLGFGDGEIRSVLATFSVVPRPIFCCLTESNYLWTISQLAEHLEAEHEEMRHGRH
jgi:hypothetical protein